ncbi:MAG TPA: ABC transporter substrate-binding protein [Burkholderiales bacterium]|jgi:putative ABC transport system substrate-binding protein
MTSRRTFLSTLLVLASARLAAQDKAARVRRIGFLDPVSLQANGSNMYQFRKGMKELGYTEGGNLSIEYRSAEGRSERFAQLARELSKRDIDLIVTSGTPATLAAMKAKIPVVTASVVDPVDVQVVASLERPAGNVTGMAVLTEELEAKRLELLRAIVPGKNAVAAIMDMGNPGFAEAWKAMQPAAARMGMKLELIDARKPEEVVSGFATAVAHKADAAVVRLGSLTIDNRRAIVEAAAGSKMPAIYNSRQFVDIGGLASYGVNTPLLYYRAAAFVDKILKGAKPAELPMERATRFELVLNRATAHHLGLIIPPDIFLKSDDVVG